MGIGITDVTKIKALVGETLKDMKGLLPLRPAWVARDFLRPGRRLGLKEGEYGAGERGFICERWFASETRADNRIEKESEGLSFLDIEGENILLKDAVDACGEQILGREYARSHGRLGRLIKIYDYGCRLFYHIHQRDEDAKKVGRNPKEEAYYFLEADPGPHPETFFGVHPYVVRRGLQFDIFLPYLKDWGKEGILKHARAYLNVPGEGFHLPSGVLHAPGTALTMEIQESSDVMAVFQANVEGFPISKSLLTKDVCLDDLQKEGELAVLKQVDWDTCADPYFYENHHLAPRPVSEDVSGGWREDWIYYNTRKFSGKRLTLEEGKTCRTRERGVYNIFVWKGRAMIGEREVSAGDFDLTRCGDELLVTHERAVSGIDIVNTGKGALVLFKFFGPDINTDNIPYLKIQR